MKTAAASASLKTPLSYGVVAAAGVWLCERGLARAGVVATGWVSVGVLSGWVVVALTGWWLYALRRRDQARLARAEADLRRQEERWQLALAAVGDGVWECDPANPQVFHTRGWPATLGYGDQELPPTREAWLARVHPQDADRVQAELQRYQENPVRTYRCEYRMRAADGTYRWILARGGLMAGADSGGGLRLIGTHADITTRKSSESRMADTLAFTKAVLRCSPTGIIAFKATGAAVIANESAARTLGTDVAGLLRQNFRELSSWRDSGLLAAADDALDGGTMTVYRGALAPGGGVTLWIEARLVPFVYHEEKHLLLLLEDETAAHSALDQLRLMHAAAQAAPVGWVVTDAEGRIQWVNPAFTALTGYAAEEVVGANPRLLKSGRQPPEYYRAMWAALRRGEVWAGELINRRKNGSHYHEFNTIAPVRDKDGAVTHYVAIKQDISARKQLELQLARTQRLESIGQLACGIVHDLNNMLAPIMLSLGMIRAQHRDPETQGYVQMMEQAVQRGAGVLRQVLTFAQGVEGQRTALEPKHLIKEVADLARETFPRQIRVVVEIDAAVSQVSGDLTQVHQVLLNLAVNARDAMPTGGTLTFHARNVVVDEVRAARQVMPVKPGTYVVLGVRDTGTGIDPDVLEHMFEPFFTTKPRGKGTGLGLSTVFGIVRSYEGFIEVDTLPGRGTDIGVLFPAVVRPMVAARPDDEPTVRLAGAGRRVLVVEDEPVVRAVTGRLLTQRGFEVVTAADGQEALEKFIADPAGFVAVITDLMMPRMNGAELVRALRARAPGVPVIVSSGLSGEGEDALEAMGALGVTAVLPKPYTEAQLLTMLAGALEKGAAGGL